MAKNLEKKLNIPGKKPPGGVKLFAVQSKEDAKTNNPTKKLQVLVLFSKHKKVVGSNLLILLPNSIDLVHNWFTSLHISKKVTLYSASHGSK